MTKKLEFVFDVGGPNAYLAWKALPQILERTGSTLAYRPVSLGGIFKQTGNRAPMIRYADAPAKWAYEQLEFNRFIKAHSIPFRMNPGFPVNTLAVMRAAVASDMEGSLDRFVPAVMASMWEDARDMADPQVIAEVLSAAGLDGPALVARTQDGDVKADLLARTQSFVDRGVFGVPTFFVGEDMFWGKERLAQVEQALSA